MIMSCRDMYTDFLWVSSGLHDARGPVLEAFA